MQRKTTVPEATLLSGNLVNINPLLFASNGGKRGAGMLCDKPKNLQSNTDPSTEDVSAPWYKLGVQHGRMVVDQINDHHLTQTKKRATWEKTK